MRTIWEYMIVALPAFEAPRTTTSGSSPAVQALDEVGRSGWEAVSMTVLPEGTVAVLLKRPNTGS
jgi:hypothetical protein